ncbi:MAG: cytoplasmic protein [Ruminococcaceae bacterium]|nr:cytoplasmic protein [Oscillospiraceae bacterium]
MDRNDIIAAHKFCTNHKQELQKDHVCGCFYCLKIFDPAEIEDWIPDTKGTAKCPYCGIDSVIGEHSGFPITNEFLSKMKEYWF